MLFIFGLTGRAGGPVFAATMTFSGRLGGPVFEGMSGMGVRYLVYGR